jgi:CBS domain containing-hemolysin-like protein
MIPLTIFLLACAAVYLGTIDAAFSALMRLSLRLLAERSTRPGALVQYLDDPVLLFAPVRLLLALVTAAVTLLLARGIGVSGPRPTTIVLVSVALFIALFQVVLPRLLVIGDPERVLEALLPSFRPIARVLAPVAKWTARAVPTRKVNAAPTDDQAEAADEVTRAKRKGSSKARSAASSRASSISATRSSARS